MSGEAVRITKNSKQKDWRIRSVMNGEAEHITNLKRRKKKSGREQRKKQDGDNEGE